MIVMIILIIVLLLLSAFFSATETAFSTVNEFRIKRLAKSGKKQSKKAKIAYSLIQRFPVLLSTILVSNNIVNMALASISSYFCASILSLGATGVVYSTLAASILVIIFGEIIPKTIARIWPEKFVLFSTYTTNILCKVLKPITYWFTMFDEKVTEFANEDEDRVTATEKELVDIVETIEREGVLEHNESELIKSAINFDEISVKSVMQDKKNVIEVGLNQDFEEVMKICLEHNYSRLPVLDEKTGKAVGIILQNDVLRAYVENDRPSVKKLLNEPVFVSYRRPLPVALNLMQKDKSHLAVVVDNLREKNYLGIVTMEDILEELVGEIYDEYDDIPADVVEIGNDAFEVSGKYPLEEFFDNYLDEVEEPKTKQLYIGQWVKELLADNPIESEIYYENLKILVLEHEDNKILKVSIEVISAFDEKL